MTIVPPSSRNALSCGSVVCGRHAGPVIFWNSAGIVAAAATATAAATTATTAAHRRRRRSPRRTAGRSRRTCSSGAVVEVRRHTTVERELEALEQLARPARRHRAAVVVLQRDATRRHAASHRAGRAPSAVEADAELLRRLLQRAAARSRVMKNVPAGYVLPFAVHRRLQPVHFAVAFNTRLATVNASFARATSGSRPCPAPTDHARQRLREPVPRICFVPGTVERRPSCDRTSRPSGRRASSRRCRTDGAAVPPGYAKSFG